MTLGKATSLLFRLEERHPGDSSYKVELRMEWCRRIVFGFVSEDRSECSATLIEYLSADRCLRVCRWLTISRKDFQNAFLLLSH